MQEKDRQGTGFCQWLVDFIFHICCKCMPNEIRDAILANLGRRVFRPFPDPQDLVFDMEMELDISDMHCYLCIKCTARTIIQRASNMVQRRRNVDLASLIFVENTLFNDDKGIFQLKRNYAWLNGYNQWLTISMCANYDC